MNRDGKEMAQEERGFVCLIAFQLGMSPFAMPRVGSEIVGYVWMMRAAPGQVEGDHVMCARMKQHLNAAREGVQAEELT